MSDTMKRALNGALVSLGLLVAGLGWMDESAVQPIVGGVMALVGVVMAWRGTAK